VRNFSSLAFFAVVLLLVGTSRGQQAAAADTRGLDFKEFGLLAIQDNWPSQAD
jgi:hypothetical protein